jgi:hypothetical protein
VSIVLFLRDFRAKVALVHFAGYHYRVGRWGRLGFLWQEEKGMRTFCLAAVLLGSAAVLGVESGLQKGDAVPVFEPLHVAGPLKGNSCPT